MSCPGLFGHHVFCHPRPHSLLISPHHPSCPLSRNALSFFLRQVILDTGAVVEGSLPPRAHSIRAVVTSAAFLRNWSVSKVLEAATWQSNPVFTSLFQRHFLFS